MFRNKTHRVFLAAGAAGVTITTLGFAAASPAGAVARGVHFTPSAPEVATSAHGNGLAGALNNCGTATAAKITGTWSSTDCGKAGYVATGRNFRFASALITVPNHTGDVATDPTMYVSLDASGVNPDFARAGVRPCIVGTPGISSSKGVSNAPLLADPCPEGDTSGWEAFTMVNEAGAITVHNVDISQSVEGDGVFVSVYLVPTGNSVHVVVTPPTGAVLNNTYAVSGPVYTDAQALADWTTDTTQPAPVLTAPDPKTRDTQFFQGRFTTSNGIQGTFKGPWTLTAVDATSNGSLPPAGTLIAQPSYLWNDGHGFAGMGSDAFGIWRFPF
jgi:hypothetical protein